MHWALTPITTEKMKILIAEDDLTSRTLLSAVAGKWGYEPIAVADGESAWAALQAPNAPRLLLLDWEMPKLDGLALCQRIRQQASSNPPFIILLTARNETVDVVTGLDIGANDYITKPFENAELQARLRVGTRMLELQTELNQAKEALAFQASHDFLTGMLNRGAIMHLLEQEIARAQRQSHPLCIGLCDIDHFKQINDNHGHAIGDAVLREVARRMADSLRPYDQAGRYGGEEFLFFMAADEEQGRSMFERLRRAIADTPFELEGSRLSITLSSGVSVFQPPEDARGASALLAAADAALYQAKSAGRNRTLFAPSASALPEAISGDLG
jgi:two-component system cell cycle response regulator